MFSNFWPSKICFPFFEETFFKKHVNLFSNKFWKLVEWKKNEFQKIIKKIRISLEYLSWYLKSYSLRFLKKKKVSTIGHEIWLRIFSEVVVFAHRKWWVVGGSESNACRLARSPRIGRERQLYPVALRPSQRSAKYWLRAQNRSNKSFETTKSTSWWSKPASDTLEKILKFVILIT